MVFFDNVVPFLRTGIVAWEMCATFVVDVVFEMFNCHLVFVSVGAVNFPSF